MECFERDAAHLWFNLYLISIYCLPSSAPLSANAPLRLFSLASTTTSFIKFTSFALESLCSELSGTSSSLLVDLLPWGRDEGSAGERKEAEVLTSSPVEWGKMLCESLC